MEQAARPDIAIRLATPTDGDGLAGLRRLWEEEGDAVSTDRPPAIGAGGTMTAWMRAHDGTHLCVVAVRGEELVGMAWLAITGRPPTPQDADRRSGDVQSVFVVPGLRSCGVGGRLLGALHDAAAARGITRISVHASSAARPFYARLGYAPDPMLLVREG